MRRNPALVATAAVALSLLLGGCATSTQRSNQSAEQVAEESGEQRTPYVHYSFEEKLPDGRTVLCVWAAEGYNSGGLSCDWEGLSREGGR